VMDEAPGPQALGARPRGENMLGKDPGSARRLGALMSKIPGVSAAARVLEVASICCLNTLILITLIQQSEPSGREAGEYHG
jgi:hypothetical protein